MALWPRDLQKDHVEHKDPVDRGLEDLVNQDLVVQWVLVDLKDLVVQWVLVDLKDLAVQWDLE